MSEQTQRRRVILGLKPLHGVAVENPAGPGTPDVNYIDGWIELKWLRRWKRNAETSPVLIDHYTNQQRLWMRRRSLRGGKAYLLLQVGKEWLLFKYPELMEVGKVTRSELYKLSYKHWPNGLKNEELIDAIT